MLSEVHENLWTAVRTAYPQKQNIQKLWQLEFDLTEGGAKFLRVARQLWEEEIDEDPTDPNSKMHMMFRTACEKAVSMPIQNKLQAVVGLPNMEYAMWAAHMIKYIDDEAEK